MFVGITSVDYSKVISTTCSRIIDMHKKHNFFVFVDTSARWEKSAQLVEPIHLTPTLLMKGPAGDAGRAG